MSHIEASDDELMVDKKGRGSDIINEATLDVCLQDESPPTGLNVETELVPRTEEVKSVHEHDLATPADNNLQAVTKNVHMMTDVGIVHSACSKMSSDMPQNSTTVDERGQHAAEEKFDALIVEHCAGEEQHSASNGVCERVDGEELNRDIESEKMTLNTGTSGKELVVYQNKVQASDGNECCSSSGTVSEVNTDEQAVRKNRNEDDLDQIQPTGSFSGSGEGTQEEDEMQNDSSEGIINAENIFAECRSTAADIPDTEEVHGIDSSVSQDLAVRNTCNTEVNKLCNVDIETEQSLASDVSCEVKDSSTSNGEKIQEEGMRDQPMHIETERSLTSDVSCEVKDSSTSNREKIQEEGMRDQPMHAITDSSEQTLEQSEVATRDNSKISEGLIGGDIDDDAMNGVDGNEMDNTVNAEVKGVECDTKTASQEACATGEGDNDVSHSEKTIKGATRADEHKDLTEPKQTVIGTEPCFEQTPLVQEAALIVTDSNDTHDNSDINITNIPDNPCPSSSDLNHKSVVEECAKIVSILQDIPSNNDDMYSKTSFQSSGAAGLSVMAHVHSDTDVSGNQVADDQDVKMEYPISTDTCVSPSHAADDDQVSPSNIECKSADVENPSVEKDNKESSSIDDNLDVRDTQNSDTVEEYVIDTERVECPTSDVGCEDLKTVNNADVYKEVSGAQQTPIITENSEQTSAQGEEETEDNNKRTERLVDDDETAGNEVDFSEKNVVGDIVAIDVKEVVICDTETDAPSDAVLESWPMAAVKSELNDWEEPMRHDANEHDHKGLTELKQAMTLNDPCFEQTARMQATVVSMFHSSNDRDDKDNVFNQQPMMNEDGNIVSGTETNRHPKPAKTDAFVMVNVCNSSPGSVSVGDTFDNSHTKNGQQTKRRTLHWSLKSNKSDLRIVNPFEHVSSKQQIRSRCQRQKSTNMQNGLKLQGDQNNTKRGTKRYGESHYLLDCVDLSQAKWPRSKSTRFEKISPVPSQGSVVLSAECREKYSDILNKPPVVVLEVLDDKIKLAGLNKNSIPKITREQKRKSSCQQSEQSHCSQSLASSPCVKLEQLPPSATIVCTKSSVHPPKKTQSAQSVPFSNVNKDRYSAVLKNSLYVLLERLPSGVTSADNTVTGDLTKQTCIDKSQSSGDSLVERRCPQCDDLVPGEMLKIHFRMQHRRVKFPFPCPRCRRKFLFEDDLHEHYLRCIGVKKHKADKSLVKMSVQEKISEKKPTCPACKKRFINTKRLKDHYQIKHKCDVSQTFMSSKSTAASQSEMQKTNAAQRQHQVRSRTQDDTLARYKATEASQSELQWQEIEKRPLTMVSANVVYKCGFCPKAFTDRILLKCHMDSYHEQNKTERLIQLSDSAMEEQGDDVVFLCMHCDKYFCDLSTFREHQTIAHKSSIRQTSPGSQANATPTLESSVSHTNQNRCVLCNYKTRTLAAMRRHTRQVHGSMFSCRLCSDVFTLPYSVTRHSRIVHGTDKNVVLPIVHRAQDAGTRLASGYHRMNKSSSAHSRKVRGPKQGHVGKSTHVQSTKNSSRKKTSKACK